MVGGGADLRRQAGVAARDHRRGAAGAFTPAAWTRITLTVVRPVRVQLFVEPAIHALGVAPGRSQAGGSAPHHPAGALYAAAELARERTLSVLEPTGRVRVHVAAEQPLALSRALGLLSAELIDEARIVGELAVRIREGKHVVLVATVFVRAWAGWLPKADFGDDWVWVARELAWDAYLLRSAAVWEELCGQHTITQGGYYQYGAGLNLGFRSWPHYLLPMVWTEPALAREILRYSIAWQPESGLQLPYGSGPMCRRVELGSFQRLVLQKPVAGIQHFLCVHRRGENLAKELVGIERNGCEEFVERVRRPRDLRHGRCRSGGRGGGQVPRDVARCLFLLLPATTREDDYTRDERRDRSHRSS